MTPAAQRILTEACQHENLTLDGWEHFLTSMAGDGTATFKYDRGCLLPSAGEFEALHVHLRDGAIERVEVVR